MLFLQWKHCVNICCRLKNSVSLSGAFYLQITLPRCALIFQRLICFCSLSMKQRLFLLWVLLLFFNYQVVCYLLCLICFLFLCINSVYLDATENQQPHSFDYKGSTWSSSLHCSILLPEVLSSLMNSDTTATLLLLLVLQLSIVYTLVLFYYFCNQWYDKNRQIIPAKLPALVI